MTSKRKTSTRIAIAAKKSKNNCSITILSSEIPNNQLKERVAIETIDLTCDNIKSLLNYKRLIEFTVDDVNNHFYCICGSKIAELFPVHEIDGAGIILINGIDDLMHGFNLKMGPALKLNAQIYALRNNEL